MILADTSVWVDHLRRGNAQLRDMLNDAEVVCHPFILGEISCGSIRNRQEILGLLKLLPEATPATDQEALDFLELHHLFGRGLGWVDIHLLASALLTGIRIWTLDKRMALAASYVGIAHE